MGNFRNFFSIYLFISDILAKLTRKDIRIIRRPGSRDKLWSVGDKGRVLCLIKSESCPRSTRGEIKYRCVLFFCIRKTFDWRKFLFKRISPRFLEIRIRNMCMRKESPKFIEQKCQMNGVWWEIIKFKTVLRLEMGPTELFITNNLSFYFLWKDSCPH